MSAMKWQTIVSTFAITAMALSTAHVILDIHSQLMDIAASVSRTPYYLLYFKLCLYRLLSLLFTQTDMRFNAVSVYVRLNFTTPCTL